MLAMVAATDSASTVRKKYSVFIYSEAEPHTMYAIYINRRVHCVFYSNLIIMTDDLEHLERCVEK